MSATEVIEEIKKLPAEERKKVVEFVHALEEEGAEKKADFESSAKWALEEHRDVLRRLAQ